MDYEQLKTILRNMTPRSKEYAIVKAEMMKRGRWKYKSRGAAFKKGYDERRKGNDG